LKNIKRREARCPTSQQKTFYGPLRSGKERRKKHKLASPPKGGRPERFGESKLPASLRFWANQQRSYHYYGFSSFREIQT
jgi:hypothetical protein